VCVRVYMCVWGGMWLTWSKHAIDAIDVRLLLRILRCVCVCVCVRERGVVSVCVIVCVREWVGVSVHVCMCVGGGMWEA